MTVDLAWLSDAGCAETAVYGGKAANLARLAGSFNVPPGFAVSAGHGGNEVPDDAFRDAARQAYRAMDGTPLVAVRSSAVDEDGSEASFAGQHDTILGVEGLDALDAAIDRCWASFSAERALDYRKDQGLPPAPSRVAVLVQELVQTDAAGVVFSMHPVSGQPDELLINASWGLGESIVSGTVTPDSFVVDRSGATRETVIGAKERMTVLAGGETREVPVPRPLRQQLCIDADQVSAAAKLALDLEAEMGWPVDAEVGWCQASLFLFQCRPITRS